MWTRGYLTHRYNGRYYRQYKRVDTHPSRGGDEFAGRIPADATRREAWIKETIKELEMIAQDIESGDPVEDFEILDDNSWITNDISIKVEWVYVIDLDYRAFSVNGLIHFNLDNVPPYGISEYIDDDGNVHAISEEYLTTILQWPNPDFNVDEALKSYDALQPLVTTLKEWGAPGWDALSPAQHLSVELVKTIVSDHKHDLSTPDLSGTHPRIALACWQIACAAAPSHLLCPSENAAPSVTSLYAHTTDPWSNKQTVPYIVGGEKIVHIYCWFRGCLVAISTRLDEELYVKHEVGLMVKKLRSHGRAIGIGIILSSFQMVAVAVDGTEVRHSPALDVHNAEDKVLDGLLLLMHLLSPSFTVQKTPWKNTPILHAARIRSILPPEIVRHIVHMTDDDTYYFVLPLVSRGVRSFCAEHPRVGDYVLLGVRQDRTFKVLRSTGSSMVETYATLIRTHEQMIRDRLLCTFQHHQTGRVGAKITDESVRKELYKMGCWGTVHDPLWWDVIVKGDLPEIRIQVVEGVWNMVELGSDSLGET